MKVSLCRYVASVTQASVALSDFPLQFRLFFQNKEMLRALRESREVELNKKKQWIGSREKAKAWVIRGMMANFVEFAVDQIIFVNLVCGAVTKI